MPELLHVTFTKLSSIHIIIQNHFTSQSCKGGLQITKTTHKHRGYKTCMHSGEGEGQHSVLCCSSVSVTNPAVDAAVHKQHFPGTVTELNDFKMVTHHKSPVNKTKRKSEHGRPSLCCTCSTEPHVCPCLQPGARGVEEDDVWGNSGAGKGYLRTRTCGDNNVAVTCMWIRSHDVDFYCSVITISCMRTQNRIYIYTDYYQPSIIWGIKTCWMIHGGINKVSLFGERVFFQMTGLPPFVQTWAAFPDRSGCVSTAYEKYTPFPRNHHLLLLHHLFCFTSHTSPPLPSLPSACPWPAMGRPVTPPTLPYPTLPPTPQQQQQGPIHGTTFPLICYSLAGTCGPSLTLLVESVALNITF